MVKDLTGAERQKRARDKKRSMGLVSLQVWVPPWGRKAIRDLEDTLCNTASAINGRGMNIMGKMTSEMLLTQLEETDDVKNGEISVVKMDGETPIIRATVQDIDEFPVMLSVGEEQILAMTDLWGVDDVQDGKADELNAVLLRANLPVPLSAFSIVGDRYVIFGALSINSDITEIIEEIVTLSNNVVDAIEYCGEFLRP